MPYPDLTVRADVKPESLAILGTTGTATLYSMLARQGVRSTFLAGLTPLHPQKRMVGRAYTLRYLPAREDMDGSAGLDDLTNLQRKGVEEIGPGEIFVVDARGNTGAGSMGEILATRIFRRGGTGIVTDGALRDSDGIRAIGEPVYTRAAHAGVNTSVHFTADLQIPIACAGVMVCPGDVLVGDGDGVIVIPQAMADRVAAAAAEYEPMEAYIRSLVEGGASIRGVYPPNEATRAAFAVWRAKRMGEKG